MVGFVSLRAALLTAVVLLSVGPPVWSIEDGELEPCVLLVAIRSHALHSDARSAIRATWGQDVAAQNGRAMLRFVIPKVAAIKRGELDIKTKGALTREQSEHNDLMMLESVLEVPLEPQRSCAYYLLTHDDTSVHVASLLRILGPPPSGKVEDVVWGTVTSGGEEAEDTEGNAKRCVDSRVGLVASAAASRLLERGSEPYTVCVQDEAAKVHLVNRDPPLVCGDSVRGGTEWVRLLPPLLPAMQSMREGSCDGVSFAPPPGSARWGRGALGVLGRWAGSVLGALDYTLQLLSLGYLGGGWVSWTAIVLGVGGGVALTRKLQRIAAARAVSCLPIHKKNGWGPIFTKPRKATR